MVKVKVKVEFTIRSWVKIRFRVSFESGFRINQVRIKVKTLPTEEVE